jgi:hypothetical protein
MTKVEARYRLSHPLSGALLARIADAHSVYGIVHIHLDPASEAVTVEYDASRLTTDQVDAVLRRAGIPAQRQEPILP